MGPQPQPPSQRARAALPPGLRPLLDSLRTVDTTVQPDEADVLGFALLRRHLADHAPQTRRAYLTDWKRWTHWCRTNDRTPLPANPTDIALYLAQAHDTGEASQATLQRWTSTIATTHTANGYPEPTHQPPVPELLRQIRQAKPRPRPRGSRWLTDMELKRVIAHTREESWPELVIQRRDRLIMLLTRATGDSPDEILALRAGELLLGGDTMILHRSNQDPLTLTDPLPATDWATCLPCSLVLWRQVLDLADDSNAILRQALEGPERPVPRGHVEHSLEPAPHPESWLLRRVRRGGNVTSGRMANEAVRTLLRTHATAVGVDTTGLTAFALRPHP